MTKKQLIQQAKTLLKARQHIDLTALSDQERHWLNERGFEQSGNVLRVICEGESEAKEAREILNKIKGDSILVARIVVNSPEAVENLKTIMKG